MLGVAATEEHVQKVGDSYHQVAGLQTGLLAFAGPHQLHVKLLKQDYPAVEGLICESKCY